MAYDPIESLNFIFDTPYVPPAGDAIDFIEGGSGTGTPWYDIPSGITPGIIIPFAVADITDKRLDAPWGGPSVINAFVSMAYADSNGLEIHLHSSWRDLLQLYKTNRAAWGRLLESDGSISSMWNNPHGYDHARRCPYGSTVAEDITTTLLWFNPPAKDQARRLKYAAMQVRDNKDFAAPWRNPPENDLLHHTLWGKKYYQEICVRNYEIPPGTGVDFNLDNAITAVGTGTHVDFWFDSLSYDRRCSQREPSGWRDAYTYGGFTDFIPTGKIKKVYVLNNLAAVTRISDNAPVEVKSVTIATDIKSWCWSLSCDVGSDLGISMLDPGAAGTTPVKIEINDFTCVCQVDGWNHGVRFIGDSRSVSGRSLSAELAAPAAAAKTYIEPSAKNARQIAEDALQYTGWSLSWLMDDWLVPAGVFSCVDNTPMQILQSIAEAGGGFVQSHPETKTVVLAPVYKSMPWEWDTATPDIIIPENMMDSIDSEWQARPPYNGVIVSGTVDGGISMGITRNGTAGDLQPGMVTDPLLTATEVCRARGKYVLAGAGNRKRRRISLPVMRSPDVPGVILPGQLVSVTGAVPWRAMVVSVAVTAAWQRALVVRQVVELEQYYGS